MHLRTLLLTALVNAAAISCKPRASEADLKSVVTVGDDGKILVFFKERDHVVGRSCPDLTIIDSTDEIDAKCPKKGDNEKRWTTDKFAARLKGVFFATSVRDFAKNSPYRTLLGYDEKDLDQMATSAAELRQKVEQTEKFIAKFPSAKAKLTKDLASLKKSLSDSESLENVITRYNIFISSMVGLVLNEDELFYVEAGDEGSALAFGMLRALYNEGENDYSSSATSATLAKKKIKMGDADLHIFSDYQNGTFGYGSNGHKIAKITFDGAFSQEFEIARIDGPMFTPQKDGFYAYIRPDWTLWELNPETAEDHQILTFTPRSYKSKFRMLRNGCFLYPGYFDSWGTGTGLYKQCRGEERGTQIQGTAGADIWIEDLAELADGRMVVSANYSGKNQYELWMFDANGRRVKLTSFASERAGIIPWGLAPLPSGNLLFTANVVDNNTWHYWIINPYTRVRSLLTETPKIEGEEADKAYPIYPTVDQKSGAVTLGSYNKKSLYYMTLMPGDKDTRPAASQGATSNNPQPRPSGSTGSSSSTTSSQNSVITKQDVLDQITANKSRFSQYNSNTSAVSACKSAGASARWTTMMQDYYCTFPGGSANAAYGPQIRECFTGNVRPSSQGGKGLSYTDGYNDCAKPNRPMEWISKDKKHDAIFRAVMIDRKF